MKNIILTLAYVLVWVVIFILILQQVNVVFLERNDPNELFDIFKCCWLSSYV